jgi:TolA-binding protein
VKIISLPINLKSLRLAAVAVLFSAISAFALSDIAEDDYSKRQQAYYSIKLKNVTAELILQEKLLSARLKVILNELRRSRMADELNLDDLLVETPEYLSTIPEGNSEQIWTEQLKVWIVRQRELLAYKLDKARKIQERLIATQPELALQETFKFELRQAIDVYAKRDFGLAALLFTDIIEAYPYRNMDDVLFYQAEACYSNGIWDSAAEGFSKVLSEHPESVYRNLAFKHLLEIRNIYQQHYTASSEYVQYSIRPEELDFETIFLAGREFFLSGHSAETRDLLDLIPIGDENYLRARHLVGTSYINERRYHEAITVFEELSNSKGKNVKNDYVQAIKSDALLKLGYLYFEISEFDKAAEMFASVEQGAEQYSSALLGQAWSDMSLADYDRAFALSSKLVEHYPDSPLLYEAQTLAGYAAERLDNPEAATDYYKNVLDEADRSQQLKILANEKRQVLQVMRELAVLETEVFEQGNVSAYPEYVRLRRESKVLMRKVKYSELSTANTSMSEFIEERAEIVRLNRRLSEMFADAGEDQSTSSQQEMASLQHKVTVLMSKIRIAGFIEIQKQPLMLHETTLNAANTMLDSLDLSSKYELERLNQSADNLVTTGNPGSGRDDLQLAYYRNRYTQLGRDVEQIRHTATTLRHPTTDSNLGRWSELAFSRLAIGDIPFDELHQIDERLDELNGYLDRINDLIESDQHSAPNPAPLLEESIVPKEENLPADEPPSASPDDAGGE